MAGGVRTLGAVELVNRKSLRVAWRATGSPRLVGDDGRPARELVRLGTWTHLVVRTPTATERAQV